MRSRIEGAIPPSNQISVRFPYSDHSSATAATLMASNCAWDTLTWPGSTAPPRT
jgi:hypothetical protein